MAEKTKKPISVKATPKGASAVRERGEHRAHKDFDLFFETSVAPARAKSRREDWWVMPIASVMLLTLFAMGYLATNSISRYASFREMRAVVDRQTFYSGITIDDVDVSGMTLADALSLFAEREAEMREKYTATLTFEDKKWMLNAEDMGYTNNYRQVINSAWAIGRYGSLEDRYEKALTHLSDTQARMFPITQSPDKSVLRKKTDAIADELSIEPINAKIKAFDADKQTFVFTDTREGRVVDKDKLAESVIRTIAAGGHQVTIERERYAPKRTAVELSAVYGQIASATTDASGSTKNRLTNIALSLKAIDGYQIKPGETFSFNGVVGQRTSAKGYKPAGAIENGIMTQQVGGGICQVSTTLFNAVVKSNLEVVDRRPHSRPSTYVDRGKDAAVDWPNQDFKFKNNTSNPVYISARLTDKKRVVIAFYGEKLKDGTSIVLESVTTQTIKPGGTRYVKDSSLASGQEVMVEGARNGYKAETYKVYLNANNEEVKRELLCTSTYASSGAVVKVGS